MVRDRSTESPYPKVFVTKIYERYPALIQVRPSGWAKDEFISFAVMPASHFQHRYHVKIEDDELRTEARAILAEHAPYIVTDPDAILVLCPLQ